jgi:hypothetical protein
LYGKRLDAAWYMIILLLATTSTKHNHPTPSSWAKRRTWTFVVAPSPNTTTPHRHPGRSEGPGLSLLSFIHRRFQYKHPGPSLRSGWQCKEV